MYSTCTLNPVEDEAVICNLLQKAEGTLYVQISLTDFNVMLIDSVSGTFLGNNFLLLLFAICVFYTISKWNKTRNFMLIKQACSTCS